MQSTIVHVSHFLFKSLEVNKFIKTISAMDAHVSTLCGNIVGIPHGSSMRALEVVHHSTYDDTWHCGTPIHLVSPLAIHVVSMEMMASGGTLGLSTYDGNLFQDDEVIPNSAVAHGHQFSTSND